MANSSAGGLLAKFSQNKDLCCFLLSTDQKDLIESSPHDLYWGSGVSLSNKICLKKDSHSGKNVLGQILMSVRAQLNQLEEQSNLLSPANIASSPMH
jgi:hypothetical protein